MAITEVNPTQIGLFRYCLESTEDRLTSPKEEFFEKQLIHAKENLDDIEKKQREISANLYSYSADHKNVIKTHEKWHKTIAPISKELTIFDTFIKNLHEELPFLPSLTISKQMSSIHHLELRFASIQKKVTQLSLLLQSPLYANAIILFKTTIESCEEVYSQYKNGSQKQALEAIGKKISKALEEQQNLLKSLPEELQAQTILVHQELTQFYQKALIQSDHLSVRASAIVTEDQLLESVLVQYMKQLYITEENKEERKTFVKRYFNDKKQRVQSTELRKDLALCSGGTTGWITKAANPDIRPFLDSMERLARELEDIQDELQTSLLDIYKGHWGEVPITDNQADLIRTPFEMSLCLKERELTNVRQSLYPLLQTKQIRVGLYYAARLFAHIEEIRFIFNHFANNLSRDNRDIIEALNNTYKCLAIFEKRQREQIIESIFFAARSIAKVISQKKFQQISLSPYNERTITCLQTIIVPIAKQAFEVMAKKSANTWTHVVTETPIHVLEKEGPGLPFRIQQYLENEITQWLFFSKNISHIKLDMVLNVLTLKPYNRPLKESLKKNDLFRQIYQSYHPTSPPEITALFCSIFSLIIPQDSHMYFSDPYIFSYSKCIAYLYKAKAFTNSCQNEIEKKELNGLIAEAELMLDKNQINSSYDLGSPYEPKISMIEKLNDTRTLLHVLSKALWLDGGIQEEASKKLQDYFSKIDHTNFSLYLSSPLNYLIATFTLRRAQNNCDLCNFEQLVIKKTFQIHQEPSLFLPDELKKICNQLHKK